MLIRMFRSPMDPVRELRWHPPLGTSVRELLHELEWPLSEPRTRVAAKGIPIPRDDWDSSVDDIGELLVVGVPDAETLAAVGAFFAAVGKAAGGAIVAGAASVPGAAAVGGFVGGTFGLGAFGTGVATVVAAGTITAGLGAIAGSFVQGPDQDLGSSSGKSSPTQAGSGNQIRRGDPFPFPVGTIGFQPPQGAIPYSYVQGNETVVVYLFVVSKGLVSFDESDITIGESALSEYPRVEVAVRNGDDMTDNPLTLYTNRILQVSLNQSFDPIPHDDDTLISAWTVVTVPGTSNTELGVDVDVPQGVGRIGNDGNNLGYAWAMDIEFLNLTKRAYWDLNGTDEVLRDLTERAVGIANTWSVSFVATKDAIDASFRDLLEIKNNTDNSNRILLRWDGGLNQFNVIVWDSTGTSNTNTRYATTFTAGAPTHLVVTYNGNDANPVTVYVNGAIVPVASGVNNPSIQTDTPRAISLGGGLSGERWWNGHIQDMLVTPEVLTLARVEELGSGVNSANPAAGFFPVLHFSPIDSSDMGKNYGSGSPFDLMLDAQNITAVDDRVAANLFPDDWTSATAEASFSGARGPDQVKTLDGQTYVEFRGFHRRPLKRGYRWTVAEGRYQIRMRRREVIARRAIQESTIRFGPVIWYAAKGFDYLSPVLEEPDVATIELRAPLDENFQGIQNNLLVTVSRPVRIYDPMAGDADADGWTASKHESSNGSAVLREILQGPANRRSVPDSQIDVDAFSAFYTYCDTFNDGGAGGLTFDAPFDGFAGIVETCRIVAAGCRAQFTRDSTGRWTVIPDSPQPATPRASINAANSSRYRMELTFPRKIHGVRAQFTDAATGYDSSAEMVVYDDGYSADGSGDTEIGTDLLTVRYDGATRPELVNALVRYFLVNRRLRRYVHEVEMDPEHIHLPVGSLVVFSHPGALKGKAWGRVSSVSDAVFRDVLDTNTAETASRSVANGSATYADHGGPLLNGKGAARIVATSGATTVLTDNFGTALRNWTGFTVGVGVQPLAASTLGANDGVRIRLYGPTINDWAEWNFGTADGLSISTMTRISLELGTDAPDATAGSFSASQVLQAQVRLNVVGPANGNVWRVNDLRVTAGDSTVREIELDQIVEFAVGQAYAVEVRRVLAVQIDTVVDQYLTKSPATFGLSADRLVRHVYLVTPVAVDGDSVAEGDLFQYGNPSTVSERVIVKDKIAGENLTARVRLSPEAPGVHTAVEGTPSFSPLSSYDAPLTTLGPVKPSIRDVITDERALIVGSGGVLRTRAIVSVFTPEAIGRPSPTYYSLKYRKTSPTASPAVSLPLVQASTGQIIVEDVEDGFTYEFVVQGVDRDFRTSPPATTTALVVGKTTPPPDVLGFRIEGGVNLRWTLGGAAPMDLAGYEIRKGPVGGTFEEARVISGPSLVASSPYDITELIDQPGNAKLYIVAVDTNGNRSITPGVITGFIGVVPAQNVVTTADFHAAGFTNLVDQADSVLVGFEDLIGKETPDGNLLIPEFVEVVDVDVIEGSGTLQPSTAVSSVLDTERTTVNAGLQAVRATDDTGNGCVFSLEYIEPKNGVDSEWSVQFYGDKSGSWDVTVRFIDANDPEKWSQYDFSSVAGLAYADLAITNFPGTADSTGSSGAINPAAVSRIEVVGVHASQAVNDSMVLDDMQWEGGSVNGLEVEGGSGDLIQRASTVLYSSNLGALFYDASPSSLFYDQETYLAGVYEFEYTPPTADVPVDLRVALTEDNGAAFTIQYKLAAEDTYLDFPGVLRDVSDVTYDFRVLVESGLVQARFSKFQIELDVPDESETIEDFTVASSGTVRLPITKSYREIRNLFFTVQDDGNGGDSVRVLDYDETNGPSVIVTSAGTRVEGVIDAHVIGVRGT